jgi:hypothetical protein
MLRGSVILFNFGLLAAVFGFTECVHTRRH